MDTTSRFRIDAIELGEDSSKKPVTDTPVSAPVAQPTLYIRPPKTASSLDCLQLTRNIPPNLDLIGAQNQRIGLAYAYLGAVEYYSDPSDQHIILHHSLYEVTIRGVELEVVYEALLERKALWIRQVDMNFIRRYEKLNPSNDNESGAAPMVSEIQFVRKS